MFGLQDAALLFLLQILLLAQHVSSTAMPIIRSSRVLYGGCCLWYFVLWFSSCWSGVELRVMCPVCRMMPIIRSSRVLYSGCCLWYFVLWFSSCWSGVELRVMCPVCRMLHHPANRTHNPQLMGKVVPRNMLSKQ